MPNQKSMWPIIRTWINLPFELRQLFGPMFWVGIIPGVLKGNEAKSLEQYLELVTNEIIQSTEFPARDQLLCSSTSNGESGIASICVRHILHFQKFFFIFLNMLP